jgi:general secretion pathway protein C
MAKRSILRFVNIILGAALVISVLFLARGIVSFGFTGPAGRGGTVKAAPPVVKPPEPLTAYASLTKDNVFGLPAVELRPLLSNSASGGSSSIELIGTVSGALGYAIIARDSGPAGQEVYRLGELIPQIGYLRSIDKDSITVENAGTRTKVEIKDLEHIKEVSPPAAGAAEERKFARETSKTSYLVDKGAVQEAMENPAKILTQARMLPNFKNGKQEGFVVHEIKPEGVFNAIGLQDGDVLLRINNFEISGPDAALRAFTALKGMDRMDLDIVRGGQKLTLTYQIR